MPAHTFPPSLHGQQLLYARTLATPCEYVRARTRRHSHEEDPCCVLACQRPLGSSSLPPVDRVLPSNTPASCFDEGECNKSTTTDSFLRAQGTDMGKQRLRCASKTPTLPRPPSTTQRLESPSARRAVPSASPLPYATFAPRQEHPTSTVTSKSGDARRGPHLIPPPPFDLPAAFNLRAAFCEHPIFHSLLLDAAARRCVLLDAGE
ncbi:hypothetical protein DFP72DRAFT_1081821 [Ephemerocybe angulata]|uniref:Uncharacterized protein n=1 Tax=Ephemerocybe angulata TaxID=980116 RepID=A0A8H6HB12_9AGAR|nr:hypothetical protein DFP72DRAFT_1081821 [Tulosesus angulatus]